MELTINIVSLSFFLVVIRFVFVNLFMINLTEYLYISSANTDDEHLCRECTTLNNTFYKKTIYARNRFFVQK